MRRLFLITLSLSLVVAILPIRVQADGNLFTSFVGFEIGTVRLSEIKEKFGDATLIETGDAGEHVAKICYSTDEGLIYFLSGEMGGPDHRLLGYAASNQKPNDTCAEFPSWYGPLSLEKSGLYLGMTRFEFENVLSNEINWEGNVGRSFFISKREMTKQDIAKQPVTVQRAIETGAVQNYFDVGVTIVGYFSNDSLNEFQVWKIETF